jgi:hypothetical protein
MRKVVIVEQDADLCGCIYMLKDMTNMRKQISQLYGGVV